VALADQQPVRVQALELAGFVDGGDGNDRASAACEGVRGYREGAEDIDDDREPASGPGARDEVGEMDLSQPPPAWRAAA
jgi:hypothetical protein